jgi:preprotein translocase subunit SecE
MNITNYVAETKAELKHVSWPTRRQTIVYTAIVIVLSIITGLLLGLFDFIFNAVLRLVIGG